MTGQPRRKVAIVVKGYPRLSETFVAQELHGLEEAGLDLVIVSLRKPTDIKRHQVHAEVKAPVLYLPEYLHHSPWRVLRGLVKSARKPGFGAAIRGFMADLGRDFSRNRARRFGQAVVLMAEWPADAGWLHAHFIHTPASVARYASMIMGIPFTVSAHAKDIWTTPDWELALKLDSARWVVTCTRSGLDHLQTLAADPARVHLSYHGLNLQRFTSNPTPRPPRDGSSATDPVIILSVGRAVPKKGYDVLLRALAMLPPDLHWRLVHVGDGEERPMLKLQSQTLEVADRITWLGAVDQGEVLKNYRAADLFVLASRVTSDGDRDGLPNVLVEAASQGLTCVASEISAIPELFEDGVNGLLVPPDDPPELARVLEQAIRKPGLRQKLGATAEAKVRETLDYHSSVAQLVGLFEQEWREPA